MKIKVGTNLYAQSQKTVWFSNIYLKTPSLEKTDYLENLD